MLISMCISDVTSSRQIILRCTLPPIYLKKLFNVQREQLTDVILSLLAAWSDPLSQLHRSMSQDQNQNFNDHSYSKALEISDMVHELREGVAIMAEKVRTH